MNILIFANCHGAVFNNALKRTDDNVKIEHILSYENLDNYSKIEPKFRRADILIIQPVSHYEDFKMENIQKVLKPDCLTIRVPFIRFEGFWPANDSKKLNKFKNDAVMFFPCINSQKEVRNYLIEKNSSTEEIRSNFKNAVDKLRSIEKQGDVRFIDYFMDNYKSVPLFRDAYHPTAALYEHIASQICNTIEAHKSIRFHSRPTKPLSHLEEYGHFKPIKDIYATTLGLNFDLNSYFKYSRYDYLSKIIKYETDSNNSKKINRLSELKSLVLEPAQTSSTFKPTPKLEVSQSLVAYNSDWQYPAVTEKHAFMQIRKHLIESPDAVYLALPWATLLDKIDRNKLSPASPLAHVVEHSMKKCKTYSQIITVCQHIGMLKHQKLFKTSGVTDVFWSHATKDQNCFPDYPEIKIHPFPLYPVQFELDTGKNLEDREFLYSFMGAESNKWYLTNSRSLILQHCSQHPRGFIEGKNGWHYNKTVYQDQVLNNSTRSESTDSKDADQRYQQIIKKSIFSLCPSGTGPNSIRLWESIGYGSIPVILAETYLPPGNHALWDEAVIFCKEDEESIRALPKKLENLSNDRAYLTRKRKALKQLWMLYGTNAFVYDIEKLLMLSANKSLLNKNEQITESKTLNDLLLDSLTDQLISNKRTNKQSAHLMLLSCGSRLLTQGSAFSQLLQEDQRLNNACQIALKSAPKNTVKEFTAISTFKSLAL